jgi:hypothetical protein
MVCLAGIKKLQLSSVAMHVCVQSRSVGEKCSKQVKETNEWTVVVAEPERKGCYSDRMGECEVEWC